MRVVASLRTAVVMKARQIMVRVRKRTTSTVIDARSVSDDGIYPEFCARASRESHLFQKFRSDSRYRHILEHLTSDQGLLLVEWLREHNNDFLDPRLLEQMAKNDLIGSPPVVMSVESVVLSPTTLRYLKVASDIQLYFDMSSVNAITEIGVGYGGQIRVLDALGIGSKCTLFDLSPVLMLASRYLDCFILRGSYRTQTVNQCQREQCDLVLSMYALSELPRALQLIYFEKVLKYAPKGYLIMNDCWTFDRLSKDEWIKLLDAEVLPEIPQTAPRNYVLLWGHKNAKLN